MQKLLIGLALIVLTSGTAHAQDDTEYPVSEWESELSVWSDEVWRFDAERFDFDSHVFHSIGSETHAGGWRVSGRVGYRGEPTAPHGFLAHILPLAEFSGPFMAPALYREEYTYIAHWVDASACHAYIFDLISPTEGIGKYYWRWRHGRSAEECWRTKHPGFMAYSGGPARIRKE